MMSEDKKINKIKLIIIQISILLFILALWELSATLGIINEFLISKPSSIMKLLWNYVVTKEIFRHMYISLFETLLGIIIGSFIGILIASLLWYFDKIVEVINPFLVVLNALPKTALAPIMIIWAGTGVTGVVFF